MNSRRDGSRTPWFVLCMHGLLFCISQIPLWATHTPPLLDYPNHLARMHVLAHTASSSILQQFYEVHWAVLPNLAMDLVVPGLTHFIPLEVAGKIFITLTLLLLYTGTIFLHHALHRHLSWWPALAILVLYNRILLWGFLNYLFGLGLALWAFGLWIYWRHRQLKFVFPVFSLLTILIFLSHLFALGFYALAILAYELGRVREQTRDYPWSLGITKTMSQFIIPTLLLFISPSGGSQEIIWGNVLRKIIALAGVFRNYNPLLDTATVLVIAILVMLGLLKRSLTFNKGMYWPVGMIAVAFLAMPKVLFSADGADGRLALPLVLILIASTDLVLQHATRWIKIPALCLLVMFLFRTAEITIQWREFNRYYADLFQAIEKLPEGTRLFTAVLYSGGWQPFPLPVDHFSCFAVIRKSAFVPSIFASRTQQPIRLTPRFQEIVEQGPVFTNRTSPPWRRVLSHYHYVLLFAEDLQLPNDLERVADGYNFSLYRVVSEAPANFGPPTQ